MCEEKLNAFLLRFPGIQEVETKDPDTKELKGIVAIGGCSYGVHISCPNWPQITTFHVKVQEMTQVQRFLAAFHGVEANWSLNEMLAQLPNLLVADELPPLPPYAGATKENLFAEIARLYSPKAFRIQMNKEISRIRFSNFKKFEQHFIELHLPSLQVIRTSLPIGPWADLLINCNTLDAVLSQFKEFLEDLSPFYACLADFDEMSHVLQPSKPTTKDNWRLFVLRERVFIKLIIADPLAPLASMSVLIIGSTHEVEELRNVYSEGQQNWDGELDVHKNLLRIFDLCYFPMPSETSPLTKCNICFTQRLENDEVPIVSCDSPSCTLLFHPSCLKSWFKVLINGREFMDVSFGECPLCKAKLSTSFAVMLHK